MSHLTDLQDLRDRLHEHLNDQRADLKRREDNIRLKLGTLATIGEAILDEELKCKNV